MKLVSYSTGSSAITPGILLSDVGQIIDLNDLGYPTLIDYIKAGLPAVNATDAIALDQVRLHAPLPAPPRIFAIGLNYRDHARESGMEIPTTPVVFFKLAPSVVGPGDAIVLPRNS